MFTARHKSRVADSLEAGLDRVVFMDEILLRMRHDLPFNNVASAFPEVRIYRWCNSMVDYLEFVAPEGDSIDRLRRELPRVVASLHSTILYRADSEERLDVMVRCRCTPRNSTVRMTERASCLWKPPVLYDDGREQLTVLAPDPAGFRSLYRELRRVAEVEILKKVTVSPDVLRDSYTLSLSSLFQGMTGRQLRILLRAIEQGYFAIPKRSSLEQLAKAEAIGDSTLQEHLSKAESRLVEALAPYLRLYETSTER